MMAMQRDDGKTETARLEEPSPEDSAPNSMDHDDGLILWMLSLSPEKRLKWCRASLTASGSSAVAGELRVRSRHPQRLGKE